MDFLAGLLVNKPLTVLLVALVFAIAYGWMKIQGPNSGHRRGALLVATGGWALYAIWEWLVTTRTPDANIRVDLLVIWPILWLLSIVCVFLSLRCPSSPT